MTLNWAAMRTIVVSQRIFGIPGIQDAINPETQRAPTVMAIIVAACLRDIGTPVLLSERASVILSAFSSLRYISHQELGCATSDVPGNALPRRG